jgi:hypothetical protein
MMPMTPTGGTGAPQIELAHVAPPADGHEMRRCERVDVGFVRAVSSGG